MAVARLFNDPMLSGCVVEEKVRCGKKNCRCYTKSQKHTAFYLHYREYVFNPGKRKRTLFTSKKKKKYLTKKEASKIKRQIFINKAMLNYHKYPDWLVMSSIKEGSDETLYETYKNYLELVRNHGKVN